MITDSGRTLDQAMNSISTSSELPLPLPAIHVSIARWFHSVAAEGLLRPQLCRVFGQELLYLFYGGLFYRPLSRPTRNAVELPVAFLFDPKILIHVLRYYPFDTGAVASGKFGIWSKRLEDFRGRYQVQGRGDWTVPCKMVANIYETNSRYLVGAVSDHCNQLPYPFPELYEFLSSDVTFLGADQRQLAIECHISMPMSLANNLLWIACPEALQGALVQIYQLTKPSMPRYYLYPSHVVSNPAEVAAQLQLKAAEEVERFIRLPGDSQS